MWRFIDSTEYESMKLTDRVTRVEVVDETGRAYTKFNVTSVELHLQDTQRTLKIFLKVDPPGKTKEEMVKGMAGFVEKMLSAPPPGEKGGVWRSKL